MTIIKKFEPEEQKNTSSKKYFSLGIVFLLILMLAQIWASNSMAEYGEKFEKLSVLAKTLRMENQIFENEVAKRRSLANVASKSAELGFSAPESIQYIR